MNELVDLLNIGYNQVGVKLMEYDNGSDGDSDSISDSKEETLEQPGKSMDNET